MASQMAAVKEDYLQATYFCDKDHPMIKKKADELTKGTASEKEAALEIFYFVRDGILFGADRYNAKASDTLIQALGFCIPKANLQIALLRSAGIPARYHQVTVKKNSLKGIVAEFAYNVSPDEFWYHPWCECLLTGRWVICECLFDKALYEKAILHGFLTKEQLPSIDWDGDSDLCVVEPWITEDHGTMPSFDDVISKAIPEQGPEFIGKIGRHFSNRYTHKLRTS
jgi:hypothetical protein